MQVSPSGGSGKEPACQCSRSKRRGFDPTVGRSPGEEHGNPLQQSCLENPRDGGAWWAAVYGVAQSWTRLESLSSSSSSMSIESVMPSNHLILCCPLLLSIFPTIRVFSNESVLFSHQVAKVELQHQPFQWIFRVAFLPGATTGDPTHDNVMWKRTVKQGFRTQWAP